MHITCKRCGAEIPAEHVNINRLIAKCSACNAVFSFQDQLPDAATPPGERLPVPLPKGLEATQRGSELTITRRWFTPAILFLTFFCVFWNGFMLVWFSIAISQGAWPMVAFGSLHGAVGLFLLYSVLTGFLNTTTITVNKRALTITHGPLPWPGNKEIQSHDLKQLYCKEHLSASRRSSRFSYEVHAILRNGQQEKLLKGLEDAEQALYMEQEIERFLEIEDQPVRGELSR